MFLELLKCVDGMQKASENMQKTQLKRKQSIIQKVEIESIAVSHAGHLLNPISHDAFTSKNANIICQGYGDDSFTIAKQTLQIMKGSVLLLSKQSEASYNFKSHAIKVRNLLESCHQELNQKRLDGHCSFLACYRIGHHFVLVKSKELECYIVSSDGRLKTISSKHIPFGSHKQKEAERLKKIEEEIKKEISQKPKKQPSMQDITEMFRSCLNFAQNKCIKDINYLGQPIIQEVLIDENDQYILLGSSECFAHFTEKQIVAMFLQERKQDLKSIGNKLIEEAKKRWKTIYQNDMSLIIVKV